MGAQRFRGADPMLSDGSTLVLLLCVVVAACRSTMLVVERRRCCAPWARGKELANSCLVGLQLMVGCVMRVRALESSFGRGQWVHAVDWNGLLVFLLVCWCSFALPWSCAPRGSFVFS